MGQPQILFCSFSFVSNTNFTEKTVGFSRIQTWIVRVEVEHADHLTTTTALQVLILCCAVSLKAYNGRAKNKALIKSCFV